MDLLTPRVPPEKRHPIFENLITEPTKAPARCILQRIGKEYHDVDGNFVEQFQSNGFNQRLWELYIHCVLQESEFERDVSASAPDFIVEKDGVRIGMEAVTSNLRANQEHPPVDAPLPPPRSKAEIVEEIHNETPAKLEAVLDAKLNKGYHRLPHMDGVPLLLAIGLFDKPNPFRRNSTAIAEFLYGNRYHPRRNEHGEFELEKQEIASHQASSTREIPSAFFDWPTTRNIGAVVFSACGTLAKFQRMAHQGDFRAHNILMLRHGQCHNHNPPALLPNTFRYEVGDHRFTETWAEGLNVYHNPNAALPVPRGLFKHSAEFVSKTEAWIPDFHPFSSITESALVDREDPPVLRFLRNIYATSGIFEVAGEAHDAALREVFDQFGFDEQT